MHELSRTVVHDGVSDEVAIEEPLEIRVDGAPLAVTMRTPDNDEELALGFLYGEGLITEPRPVGLTEDFAVNTIEVTGPLVRDPSARSFYTTSSCGVCGKGALEEVAVHAPVLPPGPTIERALLADLPERLRQPGFARTGGLHATGLFTPDGELLHVREDVGRHNAMDKVIGRALQDGLLPLHALVLCVSGRLSLRARAAVCGGRDDRGRHDARRQSGERPRAPDAGPGVAVSLRGRVQDRRGRCAAAQSREIPVVQGTVRRFGARVHVFGRGRPLLDVPASARPRVRRREHGGQRLGVRTGQAGSRRRAGRHGARPRSPILTDGGQGRGASAVIDAASSL